MNNTEETPIQESDPKKSDWRSVFLVLALIVAAAGGTFYFFQKDSKQSSEVAPSNVIDISSKPFEFSVKEIRVKKGERVRINLSVSQGMHDWVVDEFSARTKQITAGQSDSVEFVADKAGTFEYYCSVGTHRQMGMVGKLIVE